MNNKKANFLFGLEKLPKIMSTTRSIITDINTIDLCRCHTVDILQQDYIAYAYNGSETWHVPGRFPFLLAPSEVELAAFIMHASREQDLFIYR